MGCAAPKTTSKWSQSLSQSSPRNHLEVVPKHLPEHLAPRASPEDRKIIKKTKIAKRRWRLDGSTIFTQKCENAQKKGAQKETPFPPSESRQEGSKTTPQIETQLSPWILGPRGDLCGNLQQMRPSGTASLIKKTRQNWGPIWTPLGRPRAAQNPPLFGAQKKPQNDVPCAAKKTTFLHFTKGFLL